MRARTFFAAAVIWSVASGCRTVETRPVEREDVGAVVEGRVERVTPDDASLTVLDASSQEVVLVAPDAEVRIDDFKASFDDIQEGQRVRASLDHVDGEPQVVRIEILDQAVPSAGPGAVPEDGAGLPDHE